MAEAEGGKVNQDAKIASEIESAIKSILIKYSEQETRLSKIEQENISLKTQLDEIGKQPISKGIKQPDRNITVGLTKKERILDTIRKHN